MLRFAVLVSLNLLCSSSAFAPRFVPAVRRHHGSDAISTKRVTTLFAGSTKKKNKDKWKQRNEGGGGFGGVSTKTSAATSQTKPTAASAASGPRRKVIQNRPQTAAEVARLNTLDAEQRYLQEQDANALAQKEGLVAIYNQFHQQELDQNNNHNRQLVQVSQSPLMFTIDGFIDPAACNRVQNDASGCFNLFFPESVSDQLFNGQESEMDGLLFNAASSLDHQTNAVYPDGLHMDTNNRCLFRHVTCLLYLNDVPEECGGATVFPLARTLPDDPALAAANRLLAQKLSHTRSGEIPGLGLEADARLLETRVGTNFSENPETDTAIRIQPKAGRLLIFFSRDEKGNEDPRTWHAGERIRAGRDGQVTEKRILTLFKEVDYDTPPSREATTLEGYLAPQISEQRRWLSAKAQLQQALLTQRNENT